MKKLLVILLVLAMVFGMSGVVFATVENVDEEYEDWSKAPINKDVTLGNPGTVNPAETFNFTVGAGSGVRDGTTITAPAFNPASFTIDVAKGVLTGSTDINLPTFTQVGVYTYPITETEGNTAGMVYDQGFNNLVVTVINNPDYGEVQGAPKFLRVLTMTGGTEENPIKVEAFGNTFNAGDLTIRKVITGNYADPNDEFEVTVTVTPDTGKVIKAIPIDWGTGVTPSVENGVYTAIYTLKGGDSVTIKNLPYDVTYTVVETQVGGYDNPEYDDEAIGAMDEKAIETTITNNRGIDVPIGVNLDNLPYIIVLIGAVGGLFVFTIRKRFVQ